MLKGERKKETVTNTISSVEKTHKHSYIYTQTLPKHNKTHILKYKHTTSHTLLTNPACLRCVILSSSAEHWYCPGISTSCRESEGGDDKLKLANVGEI